MVTTDDKVVLLDTNVLLSATVWARLCSLIESSGCRGKQIHDANVVAYALASGVRKLVTANVGDFTRFQGQLELIDLAAV